MGFIVNCTDCLKFVPGALGVISSADEDSSDSLSDPVAKKRDIVEGSSQSVKTKLHMGLFLRMVASVYICAGLQLMIMFISNYSANCFHV